MSVTLLVDGLHVLCAGTTGGGQVNSTLERWRSEGVGPIYMQMMYCLRYRLSDITDFGEGAPAGSMSQRESASGNREGLAAARRALAEPYWPLRTPEGFQGSYRTTVNLVVIGGFEPPTSAL